MPLLLLPLLLSGCVDEFPVSYIRRLMLPVGEFVPGWEEGLSTDAPSLYSVDVPVRSDFSFRVLCVERGSGKV